MDDLSYPACRRAVPPGIPWPAVHGLLKESESAPDADPDPEERAAALGLPPYIFDLAKLDRMAEAAASVVIPDPVTNLTVNPSLSIAELAWRNLAGLLDPVETGETAPAPGPERMLAWKDPATGIVRMSPGRDEDLLALKIVVEELDPVEIALKAGVPVATIDRAVDAAVDRGILVRPPSRIRREGVPFPPAVWPEEFLAAPVFTLQWHITQECDLSCLHCYDRSRRSPLLPEHGVAILGDLRAFCRDRFVRGQVSFTGGNPFLYEHFELLYRTAVERGLATAVLGNPVPRARLETILAIQRPSYFQVSLEGLPDHNDHIRGKGNFEAVFSFLDLLRELGIPSVVMLTLTGENVDQVLPLATLLKDRTDRFGFNRLSTAGKGKDLAPVGKAKFESFLRSYLDETTRNPVLGRKDNLLNIIHHERREPLFGGCAGFGCGAAFNFISLLPDGEVHACRKFPSPIGHIGRQSLAGIYDSAEARRYRNGARACVGCPIRPVCGGCLAVAWSAGLDVSSETDPYCFRKNGQEPDPF